MRITGSRISTATAIIFLNCVQVLPAEHVQPAGKAILVVDDEDIVRRTLVRILARQDCAVVDADSGARALQLIAADRFDLIVCDLSMPGIDGWEVAARVHKTDPACPVIILTGLAQVKDREAGGRPGVAALLRKPCCTEELVRAIAGVTTPGPGMGH